MCKETNRIRHSCGSATSSTNSLQVTPQVCVNPSANPRMGRRLWVAIVMLLGGGLLGGSCSEEQELHEVTATFERLIESIHEQDADGLWGLTTDHLRRFVTDLNTELNEAERLIRTYFPGWQHDELRSRLALERLGGAADGRELFTRLLELERARADAGVRAGLEHDPPDVQGGHARIRTRAGETFAFIRATDGTWRAEMFDNLRHQPLVVTLRANAQTLRENVAFLREMYRVSQRPSTPEGAFNSLRDALVKGKGRVVIELLDAPAREVLEQVRDKLHASYTGASSGNSRRVHRQRLQAALAETHLDEVSLEEALASQHSLFQALVDNETLGALFGIDSDSAIYLVRLISRTEAVVVTTEADEFLFESGPTGHWQLAQMDDLLRAALLEPLEAALAAL